MRALVRLAVPLILSSLGFSLMGSVDVLMVGPLGKLSLGAVALGNAYATTILFFALFILGPVDALVARALGAGDRAQAGSVLRAAILLALAISLPAIVLLAFPEIGIGLLVRKDAEHGAELVREAAAYSRALAPGAPFLFVFVAFKFFADGYSMPHASAWILLVANILNVVMNAVLIHGMFGFPELGSTGSAWATTVVRGVMCAAMVGYVLRQAVMRESAALRRMSVDWSRMREIAGLGYPTAIQEGLRTGFLLILVTMMGLFGNDVLAGNQIALSVVLVAATAPIGICWALGIRIAGAIGGGDREGARRTLLAGYVISGGFAMISGVAYLGFAPWIVSWYRSEPEVAAAAETVLRSCAPYQIVAALWTVGAGGLFGMLETRFVAKFVVVAHYAIGLPTAWLLAFFFGLGPAAVWIGPAVMAATLAVVFFRRFWKMTEPLAASVQPSPVPS